MSLDKERLDSQLILEEGLKLVAYRDTHGFVTVGVGRNLDANPLTPVELKIVGHSARQLPIRQSDALYLLHNDENTACDALCKRLPWWVSLDEVRSRVMVDLTFNMGIEKLLTFHLFLAAMQQGRFMTAANELKSSVWYNEVRTRGPRLVQMVLTGKDYVT